MKGEDIMVSTHGLKVIGYFVWWTIQQVKMKRDDFKKLLDATGLDYDMGEEGKPITIRRAAFLKAVREVKSKFHKEFLIRKIKKQTDLYQFGLVDESLDTDSQLHYAHTATMIFSPATGDLHHNAPHRAYDEVKKLYDIYVEFLNSDDVRAILLNIVQQYHRIGVRARGGIYFIHEKYAKEVEKLEEFVHSLGEECYFAVAPQIDAEKSKRAIYKAFSKELKDKMEQFEKELEVEGTKTRQSTWEARLDTLKDLRMEVEFYAEALEFQAGDLTKDLKKLTKKVKEKLA